MDVIEHVMTMDARGRKIERCVVRVDGRPIFDSEEVERLRAEVERLREAAAAYFREFDHLIGEVDYPERVDLRNALDALRSP